MRSTSLVLLLVVAVLAVGASAKVSFTRGSASQRVVTEVDVHSHASAGLEGRVIAEAEDAATAEARAMAATERRLSDTILSHHAEAQQLLKLAGPADSQVARSLHSVTDVAADLLLAQGIAKKLAKKERLGGAVTAADRRKLRLALGFNRSQFKVLKRQARTHGWKKVASAFKHITKGFEAGFSRAVHKNLARAKSAATAKATAKAQVKGLYDDTEYSGRLLDDPHAELLDAIKRISERYGLTKVPMNVAHLPDEVAAHPVVRDGRNWIKYKKDYSAIYAFNREAAALLRKEQQLSARERELARRERRIHAADLLAKIRATLAAGVAVPSAAYVVSTFLEQTSSTSPSHHE